MSVMSNEVTSLGSAQELALDRDKHIHACFETYDSSASPRVPLLYINIVTAKQSKHNDKYGNHEVTDCPLQWLTQSRNLNPSIENTQVMVLENIKALPVRISHSSVSKGLSQSFKVQITKQRDNSEG